MIGRRKTCVPASAGGRSPPYTGLLLWDVNRVGQALPAAALPYPPYFRPGSLPKESKSAVTQVERLAMIV